MTRHYIKVALRNLAKYKTQTVISALSIGVSVAIFALISSFLLNIQGDSLLKQDYVKDAAIMYINTIQSDGADEWHRINASELSRIQFKTVEKLFLPDYKQKSVAVNYDNQNPVLSSTIRIDSDFLSWGAYKSAITGDIVSDIADDEIVISRQLADQLFGDYMNATGKQINVQYTEGNDTEIRTYNVVDVIPITMGDNKLRRNIGVLHSDDFGSDYETIFTYMQLRPGMTLNDVANELASYLNVSPSDINIVRYDVWNGTNNMMTIILSRAVIFFLYLFVLMTLSSSLRQWLQLLSLRVREIAIRKSLGCKRTNILGLILTENLLSITLAFAVSLVFNLLALSYLAGNFQDFFDAVGLNKPRVFYLTFYCYLSIILICLLADWYGVRHVSQDKSGLARQMKQSKHSFRNIGITVQLVICLVFLSIATVFALGFKNMERQLGIPDNKGRYETGLLIKADRMPESQIIQISESLRRTESVAAFMNLECYGTTFVASDSTKFPLQAYMQSDNDVIDFYDLELNDFNVTKSSQRYVLVDEKIRNKMIETEEWDSKKIVIDGNQYEVAGWYSAMPFLSPSIASAIITDPAINTNSKCLFYIIPKEGMDKQARNKIKEIVTKIAPERMDAYPKDLAFELLGEFKSLQTIRAIIYIMLAISILTTVSTVYAAISLDTRRRRKEMALRKINGAKSKDICYIFAKVYVIISGISLLIAVPVSLVILVAMNEQFEFNTSPVLATAIAAAACLMTVSLTLFWKIRDIMNVDPIEYLKD